MNYPYLARADVTTDNPEKGFLIGVADLGKRYAAVRRVRGDGNCFYRATLYAFLDKLLRGKVRRDQNCHHHRREMRFATYAYLSRPHISSGKRPVHPSILSTTVSATWQTGHPRGPSGAGGAAGEGGGEQGVAGGGGVFRDGH